MPGFIPLLSASEQHPKVKIADTLHINDQAARCGKYSFELSAGSDFLKKLHFYCNRNEPLDTNRVKLGLSRPEKPMRCAALDLLNMELTLSNNLVRGNAVYDYAVERIGGLVNQRRSCEDAGSSDELAFIISGCRNGDADCFSALVDAYGGRCYGYFYRLTGSSELSEELLSELFVKLVERIYSYRGGVFESWLFRIAANIFHDHLRAKQRKKKMLDVRRGQLESRFVEAKMSEDDRTDKLQIQLEKLDSSTRELIMLRFYSELTIREIAELRCEPVGTTASRLHRGLKKLREMMQ